MSKEREVTVIGPSGSIVEVTNKDLIENTLIKEKDETDEAFALRKRNAKKHRLAVMLERGKTNVRLNVELPPDLHGEWVPDDSMAITDKKIKGFWIDDEFATKRALHSDGDGKAKVGDCVFMICTKENFEILEEIRMDQYWARHGKPKKPGEKGNDEEELRNIRREVEDENFPVIDTSNKRSIGAPEVIAAAKEVSKSGVPPALTTS